MTKIVPHPAARAAPAPEPLIRPVAEAARFPVEALGPIAPAARAIQRQTQAPIAICAQSVLAVAALAAQGLNDATTLAGRAPTALFFLTIAESGERKSTVDQLAMKPIRDFEESLREEYDGAARKHKDALEIYEADRQAIMKSRKLSADDRREKLREMGNTPFAPLLPKLTLKTPTLEGITKNLGEMRASLGLFSDEGGEFLAGHSMSDENRAKTMTALSDFWGGNAVERARAGDGVRDYPGRRLSVHLMIQPAIAAPLLGDEMAIGQGFLARFLICRPASTIGSRLFANASEAGHELSVFNAKIRALLERPLALARGRRNELAPQPLPLTDQARRALIDFYDRTERAQAPGGRLERVCPFASKAAEQAARLAAVMATFADEQAVSERTMRNACTLAEFYLEEALRLVGAAATPPGLARAEALRGWLAEKWKKPTVTVRDIVTFGPGALRNAEDAKAAITILENYHHLLPIAEPRAASGGGGRPGPKTWRLNRADPDPAPNDQKPLEIANENNALDITLAHADQKDGGEVLQQSAAICSSGRGLDDVQ